jgi:hypothetical protein
MPQAHLHLQCFEIVRDICFDFATHSFPCPLLEAVQLLVDIHVEMVLVSERYGNSVVGHVERLDQALPW